MTRPESFRPDDPRVAVASPDEPLLTRAELRELEAAEAANLPALKTARAPRHGAIVLALKSKIAIFVIR